MTDTAELFARLAEPFPADAVSWRVGSTTGDKSKGMALAFIDARDVMDRLDLICGPGGWQNRYSHANGKTVCDLGIKCGDEWVWKADGAGDTDYEAEKGALSDAFKRSAVRWGIGRYLYGLGNTWVEIEPAGAKSFKIKKSELPKLRATLPNVRASAPRPAGVVSGAVLAAKASIDLCMTPADLSKWTENNGAALDAMSEDDKNIVRKHYATRQRAVRAAPAQQTPAEEVFA